MAVQTGRTVPDFEVLKLGAASGSMIDMKIDTRGEIGLDYAEYPIKSRSDTVGGVLMGKPDFTLDFSGPIDNTASTGPSTLLRSWHANQTLLSFDLQQGVRHAWESGEQQFGLTGVVASNSGVIVTKYKEGANGMYSATIRCTSGSAVLPAWGVAAEAVPS